MKVFLPPLHMKLGLIKCIVKAMAETNSKGFQYLSKSFLNISPANLKRQLRGTSNPRNSGR
jgi:hypothetical protein